MFSLDLQVKAAYILLKGGGPHRAVCACGAIHLHRAWTVASAAMLEGVGACLWRAIANCSAKLPSHLHRACSRLSSQHSRLSSRACPSERWGLASASVVCVVGKHDCHAQAGRTGSCEHCELSARAAHSTYIAHGLRHPRQRWKVPKPAAGRLGPRCSKPAAPLKKPGTASDFPGEVADSQVSCALENLGFRMISMPWAWAWGLGVLRDSQCNMLKGSSSPPSSSSLS